MQIGIIGAGNIGSTIPKHLVTVGHEVTISNSRGPETLGELTDELGARAHAGTVEDTASFGELVIEAIPFGAYDTLPSDALAGTVVVSAANYYPERDGDIEFEDYTQTGLVAAHLADSTVVKAFNTMYYETLRDEARPNAPMEQRLVLFLAGDDQAAKETTEDLIRQIGFAPLDVGSLEDGRYMEPGSPIYNEPLTLAEAEVELERIRRG